MPPEWEFHPNSEDKFSRRVLLAKLPEGKMSALPVSLLGKVRPVEGFWRWNVWLLGSVPTNRHIAYGNGADRRQAAIAADKVITQYVVLFRLGALEV